MFHYFILGDEEKVRNNQENKDKYPQSIFDKLFKPLLNKDQKDKLNRYNSSTFESDIFQQQVKIYNYLMLENLLSNNKNEKFPL